MDGCEGEEHTKARGRHVPKPNPHPQEADVSTTAIAEDLDALLTRVIAAHGKWKLHLHRASNGIPVDVIPATARLDDRCELGQWLHAGTGGALRPEERDRLLGMHARFHVLAAGHLEDALEGRQREARRALEPGSEFLKLSATLIDVLDRRRQRRQATVSSSDAAVVAAELAATVVEAGAQSELTLESAEKVSEHASALAAATEEQSAAIQEVATRAEESVRIVQGADDSSRQAVDAMQELTASTQQVVSVLALIERIAKQTRLLALNATIEAQRAGAAGRSFAVVADEVKKLAKEVGDATREVGDIVTGVERNADAVTEGLEQLATAVGDVRDAQQSIAGAVEEQRAVATDVASRVSGVADAVAGIHDNAEFVASVTTSGISQARWLQDAVTTA